MLPESTCFQSCFLCFPATKLIGKNLAALQFHFLGGSCKKNTIDPVKHHNGRTSQCQNITTVKQHNVEKNTSLRTSHIAHPYHQEWAPRVLIGIDIIFVSFQMVISVDEACRLVEKVIRRVNIMLSSSSSSSYEPPSCS